MWGASGVKVGCEWGEWGGSGVRWRGSGVGVG